MKPKELFEMIIGKIPDDHISEFNCNMKIGITNITIIKDYGIFRIKKISDDEITS